MPIPFGVGLNLIYEFYEMVGPPIMESISSNEIHSAWKISALEAA